MSYEHIFHPAADAATPVLLLLHGTGGNEHGLIKLGQALSPGAALLSPRGDVNEHGQLRFFRRFAEGVFDLDDVRQRTHQLGDFIATARTRYALEGRPIIAVGFSNGANIAATLLQLRPEALDGAILLRSMVVLEDPAGSGSLKGKRVLLLNGRSDPIVPLDEPPRLAALLRSGGAEVDLQWLDASHGLSAEDVAAAKKWLKVGSL